MSAAAVRSAEARARWVVAITPSTSTAAVLIGILIGPGSIGAIVLYAIAAIMLATSAVGYCPLYSAFGRSSHGQPPLRH